MHGVCERDEKEERAYGEEIKTACVPAALQNGTTVVLYKVSNIV